MPKRDIAPIDSGGCRLRLLRADDLEMTRSWRNDDAIRPWFRTTAEISAEQHASWFAEYESRADDYLFVIEHEGDPVGQAGLSRIDPATQTAELGRVLVGAARVRRRGVAKAAVAALLDVAAAEFGLQSVYLEVREANEPAIRLYRCLGFTETGRRDGFLTMQLTMAADTAGNAS